MKKIVLMLMVILMCALVFAGCKIDFGGSGKTAMQMSGDTGDVDSLPDTLTASKGSTFAFSLEGNDTTGYTWEVEIEDESIVELKSNEYEPEDSDAVGSGGIATLTFKTLEKGETTLKFEYAQHWDGGETDKMKQITVIVE